MIMEDTLEEILVIKQIMLYLKVKLFMQDLYQKFLTKDTLEKFY